MDILLKKYFDYLPKAGIILLSLAVCGSRVQKGFHGCFWLNLLYLPSGHGQAETAGGWRFCKFFFLFLRLPPSYTSSPPSLSQSSLSSCSLKASPCGHSSWPTLHFPIPWQTPNSSFSYIVAQAPNLCPIRGGRRSLALYDLAFGSHAVSLPPHPSGCKGVTDDSDSRGEGLPSTHCRKTQPPPRRTCNMEIIVVAFSLKCCLPQ